MASRRKPKVDASSLDRVRLPTISPQNKPRPTITTPNSATRSKITNNQSNKNNETQPRTNKSIPTILLEENPQKVPFKKNVPVIQSPTLSRSKTTTSITPPNSPTQSPRSKSLEKNIDNNQSNNKSNTYTSFPSRERVSGLQEMDRPQVETISSGVTRSNRPQVESISSGVTRSKIAVKNIEGTNTFNSPTTILTKEVEPRYSIGTTRRTTNGPIRISDL